MKIDSSTIEIVTDSVTSKMPPAAANPLTVFSDLSERPHYNVPGLPLYARRDRLSRYGYRMACHWHRDLEFIHVVSGRTELFVNGSTITLGPGEGVFINSRRLHYLFSDQAIDARFVSAVIDPLPFEQMHAGLAKAMLDSMGEAASDYILLTAKNPADRPLLFGIDDFERAMAGAASQTLNTLEAISQAAQLCLLALDRITVDSDTRETEAQGRSLRTFLLMAAFIHTNAARKISLDDIAQAGAVSRSVCCDLFRTHAARTPTDYLIDYRIAKSRDLLSSSGMSIAEIARDCGFSSPTYFSYVFRTRMHCTPRQYRDREALG